MAESTQRNRLKEETSPYLQQHAANPVDWYPWSEEALQKARDEDKPIFLSIGYSACHWCHVMEHESFENAEIAELMNRCFVNIKVDREERPDLDQIYMNAVVALSGHGGWPMSVFLTPELKPFYGGTYWPPQSRMGMPGFRDILDKVHQAWVTRRDEVHVAADELTNHVVKMGLPHDERAELAEAILQKAQRELLRAADRTHGGFGGAPKFPHPMDLQVLIRCWKRFGDDEALEVVRHTLDKMARGGIYDHLGGGFHRYSTDARWLVPHFEKMLYDNALLVPVYLEAHQATGDERLAQIVRETLDYVLREITHEEGGFYSTQDADSEGEEGKFFVWTESEINSLLGPEDARIFKSYYDVTAAGNWEGNTILNRPRSDVEAIQELGIDETELREVINRCRSKLFEARKERIAPGRDEKILVSWNGLMIAAMASAGRILNESAYTDAATQAAQFMTQKMTTEDGGLQHAWKDGRARFNAYLDDYAALINGLIELYQSSFNPTLLQTAIQNSQTMLDHFEDKEHGGFFYTSSDHETLIARNKDSQDNPTPSGNALAATALLKLARLTGNPEWEQPAVKTLELLSGQLQRVPMAGGQAIVALDFLLGPAQEIVVAAGDDEKESEAALRELNRRFSPNSVLLFRPQNWSDDELPEPLAAMLTGKTAQNGRVTTYICERGSCQSPVVGLDDLKEVL